MSETDPFAPATGNNSATVPHEDAATEATTTDENAVPKGTTAEVLDWVGEDKTRAQQALDAENASSQPRKGVVSELEKLLSE